MVTRSARRNSQFSGAAAMLRKKETEMAANSKTNAPVSPVRSNTSLVRRNSSGALKKKRSDRLTSSPSHVSPGRRRASVAINSGKDSELLSQPPFNKNNAPVSPVKSNKSLVRRNSSGALKKKRSDRLTRSPSHVSPGRRRASVASNSWKDSELLSPPQFNKNSGSKYPTSPNPNKWKTNAPASPQKGHKLNNYDPEPDIRIIVKRDVQRGINARKQKSSYGAKYNLKPPRSFPPPQDQSNVPEHIRKAREREQRRLRVLEEKAFRSASILQAGFLGWYVRAVKFPKLRAAYIKRRKKRLAVLMIQKTFRMYVLRKRYRHVIACKRRRERNMKEIKKIQKKIEKMPKKTKQDIKEKKKEYEIKKKEMLNKARKMIKEDEEKIVKAKASGKDMIKYLNEENDKVRELIKTIQKEESVLEKQFGFLTAKCEEIASNFKSLQKWANAKNESIKKHETSDQKCRFRYLPKYREDLALRNTYCKIEFRIKELYKRQLKKIIEEVEAKSKDSSLVKNVKKEMKSCKKLLEEMPAVPIPDDAKRKWKY